jgi:hypothetical protein
MGSSSNINDPVQSRPFFQVTVHFFKQGRSVGQEAVQVTVIVAC